MSLCIFSSDMRWRVNHVIQILLWYLFIANIAGALFVPVFTVFITGRITGATFSTVGFAIALASIAKSLCQLPLARALDARKGEEDDFWAMILGAIMVTVGSFALLAVQKPVGLYAVNILLGVGSAFLMAAYYAIFSHHTDRGLEGFEWSLFSVGGLTVSTAIGAAAGGVVADWYGLESLILMIGSLNFISMVLLAMLYPYLVRSKVVKPRTKKRSPVRSRRVR